MPIETNIATIFSSPFLSTNTSQPITTSITTSQTTAGTTTFTTSPQIIIYSYNATCNDTSFIQWINQTCLSINEAYVRRIKIPICLFLFFIIE